LLLDRLRRQSSGVRGIAVLGGKLTREQQQIGGYKQARQMAEQHKALRRLKKIYYTARLETPAFSRIHVSHGITNLKSGLSSRGHFLLIHD